MEGASGGHLWVVPKLVERELADDLWILSCAGKDIKEREKNTKEDYMMEQFPYCVKHLFQLEHEKLVI